MESTTVGNAIRDVLPSLRDAEFVLFTLRHDDSVATALRKLQGFKITGAPVLEDLSPQALRSAFMIDLMDLALAVAESGGRPEVMTTMPLRQLAQGRSTPGLPLIYDDAPLSEGVRALQSSGARRLLVLNQASDAPLGLLSQSTVVSWALRHLKHLPAHVLAKPVGELMGAASGVVTVRQSDLMAEALRRFVGESRSGVPVVDDGGRIVANLSLSDLRRVTPESAVDLLRLSVDGFLRATQQLPKDPVTCPPSTSLSAVLQLLHNHHVHRIHVTDEQGRPVGVFSMTDAVASLCPPPPLL